MRKLGFNSCRRGPCTCQKERASMHREDFAYGCIRGFRAVRRRTKREASDGLFWKHCSCGRDEKGSSKEMRCKLAAVVKGRINGVCSGEEKRGEASHAWMVTTEGGEMVRWRRQQRANGMHRHPVANMASSAERARRRHEGLVRGF